jgi:molybdate-binding protein/DNA-binding XRE family transcriptional regulator
MTMSSEIHGKSQRKSTGLEKKVTTTRVHEVRKARGIAAAELARRVGISRPTIYAIESGEYTPNTAIALQLARVLDVKVEDLFSISAAASDRLAPNIEAKFLAPEGAKYSIGELVRIGRVGSRMIAAPAPSFPTFLADADGAIALRGKTSAETCFTRAAVNYRNSLLIAGCDPALSMLAGELKSAGIEVINVHCSSHQALAWLKKGLVHVAGTHLLDAATGKYNLPFITSLFRKDSVDVVTFAEWEQGLVVQSGNPKRIRSVADLASRQIRIINREQGSGARDVLDCNLRKAGIAARNVRGYGRVAPSHLAAALAVADSEVDCCVATVAVAKCQGLDFIPLASERFDLVASSSGSRSTEIQALFDILNRANLRRKLAMLAGYDVQHTGEMLM